MTNPRIAILTREYPPEVYGGAGTHVEYLSRELRHLTEVSVHCWGAPRNEPGVTSHQPWAALSEPKPESTTLQAISIDLAMAAAPDWTCVRGGPGSSTFLHRRYTRSEEHPRRGSE